MFNLLDQKQVSIRAKLSEYIAVKELKGILTTKYPNKALDLFKNINEIDFIRNNWLSFDLFKPILKNSSDNSCVDYIIYEVKSRLIKRNNLHELKKPVFYLSPSQHNFFNECLNKKINVKIFAVFFFSRWSMEFKEFSFNEVRIIIKDNPAFKESKMKRIRASRLNELYHDMKLDSVMRAYEKWNEDEERELIKLFNQGLNFYQLGNYFKRSRKAIMRRLEKLGLIE